MRKRKNEERVIFENILPEELLTITGGEDNLNTIFINLKHFIIDLFGFNDSNKN